VNGDSEKPIPGRDNERIQKSIVPPSSTAPESGPATPVPRRPATIDPIAERIPEGLTGRAEAAEIILGGYFALRHVVNYRSTHDLGNTSRPRWAQGGNRGCDAVGGDGLAKVVEGTSVLHL